MAAEVLFGVIVRTIGLLISLYGFYTLAFACLYYYFPHQVMAASGDGKPEQVNAGMYLFVGLTKCIGGTGVIAIANDIVDLCY